MKRVLIITYYWPPTGGSGVQRWVKFCKYLPSFGWTPVVYTPSNPEQLAIDESLLKEIPSEVEVIKTEIREPYEIYRKLTGKKKSAAAADVNPFTSGKKSFSQKLAVWIRGNFFIPDPRASWIRPSVKFLCRYLEEHPVDVVVTTGPPQSMHLVGRALMRKLRRKGGNVPKWIADFRDPWTKMFYFKNMGMWPLAKAAHKYLERSVLAEADEVVAVSPLVQNDFAGMTDTRVNLVTNGFDEDDFSVECPGRSDKFTIVHTGLFAPDGNPINLWKVLAQKCGSDSEFASSLEIRLVGKVDPEIISAIEAAGLKRNLVNLGYMSHKDTIQEQKAASMLILPLRQDPESQKLIPGKIFEYLASRRRVLGIGQEDGATAAILKDSGSGSIFDWDNNDAFRDFVDEVWTAWKEGREMTVDSDIEKYSRKSLTRAMISIFER